MPGIGNNELNGINDATINAAGPRYTPGQDASAPNLPIQSLAAAIEALALSDEYRARLSSLESSLRKACNSPPQSSARLFKGKKRTPTVLAKLLSKLRSEKAGKSARTLERIGQAASSVARALNRCQQELFDQQRKVERGSDEGRGIAAELHNLQNLISAVDDIVGLTRSLDFRLVAKNRMFVRGEWGTGKTHFLCDIAKQRMDAGLPTLILLAHRLPTSIRPLDAVCRATRLASSPGALLRALNSAGRRAGGRALVIIDGINEADRLSWRAGLVSIARQVSSYPNVGLVVSCRSPFEQQMLSDYAARLYVDTVHTGFEEIEFDAQKEFFKYYSIPNPHVPLMVPEFTRPLFLKILCSSFADMTPVAKNKRIRDIASGQRGMTKIFEDFVIKIGGEIERAYNLPDKTCWRLLKGDQPPHHKEMIGFAVKMAEDVRTYVDPGEAAEIIRAWTGWQGKGEIQNLLRRLMTDGLLAEDIRWQDGKAATILRLPYERFSDHLICRHLLRVHLTGTNEDQIRRAFYGNRPLGKIFKLDKWGRTYYMPGLASAIMLEFPERVKRHLPQDKRELVFYLPQKTRRLTPLVEVFLEGLLWRDHSSFSKQTDHIVSVLLENANDSGIHQTLETLVCLATRAGHPYSADRLLKYLEGFDLPTRDIIWTEFLRLSDTTSVVYRLLDWIVETKDDRISASAARNLILLCAMHLTSTRRPLRDKATKCLVLLGERAPSELFRATLELLAFNDPYVGERMLAASYGVLMRRWAYPNLGLAKSVGDFARSLYDAMFKPRAPHRTTHILARDYALGSIQLARKLNPSCLGRRPVSRITPPFSRTASSIPAGSRIQEKDCTQAKSAIYMDFGNYTVGRLVEGRSPYDDKHSEYRRVLRQIKWRVLNLGYSEERFEEIDSWIARAGFRSSSNQEGDKTDRYGKKYSWIAYFEVAGMRADRGKLPHYVEEGRNSECDIDPSFPQLAPSWRPPLKRYFGPAVKSPANWICRGNRPSYDTILNLPQVDGVDGPWVLLDGFIQEAHVDQREVFTFLRGLLVSSSDLARLRRTFNSVEYPGNSEIPDVGTDHYVFAGEVPWGRTFGSYLRTSSGRARRDVREAFGRTRTRVFRKPVAALNRAELQEFVRQNRLSAQLQRFRDSIENNPGVADLSPIEVPETAELTVYERVPGIDVEIPVRSFGWESNHSRENQAGSIEYPAPALCQALRLRNAGDLVDLSDQHGKPATLYRTFDSGVDFGRSHLLYLRHDLVSDYLKRTNQRLVWLLWGERSMHYTLFEQMRHQLQDAWGKHIHKKMIVARI